eukprot:jgi/Tetstr1/430615/TSEL_001987.t1
MSGFAASGGGGGYAVESEAVLVDKDSLSARTSVAWSPDSKRLIIGAAAKQDSPATTQSPKDGCVRLWEQMGDTSEDGEKLAVGHERMGRFAVYVESVSGDPNALHHSAPIWSIAAAECGVRALPTTPEPPPPPSGSGGSEEAAAGLLRCLEASSYGVFRLAMERCGLAEDGVRRDLPCVVAIGEESAGKSSTLERVTMLPVFPKAEVFCTKMPIRVRLTHCKGGPPTCRVSFDVAAHLPAHAAKAGAFDRPVDLQHCEDPAEVVQEMMDRVHRHFAEAEGKAAVVVPHELLVEIGSPHVPTMELVDLPGIREQPEEMRDATKALCYKYVRSPATVVLCVVPATVPQLQSSQAVGIVHELGRAAASVCVISKCDDVNVSKDGPRRKLVQRLARPADDDETGDLTMAHVVGVMNRDTAEEGGQGLISSEMERLLGSVTAERDWFSRSLPDLSLESQVSLPAALAALDAVMCRHIVESWIPRAKADVADRLAGARIQRRLLGTPVADDEGAFLRELALLGTAVCADSMRQIESYLVSIRAPAPAGSRRIDTFAEFAERSAAEATLLERHSLWSDPTDSDADESPCAVMLGRVEACAARHFEYVSPADEHVVRSKHSALAGWGAPWHEWLHAGAPVPEDTPNFASHSVEAFIAYVDSNVAVIVARSVFAPMLTPRALASMATDGGDAAGMMVERPEFAAERARLTAREAQLERSLGMLGEVERRMCVQLASLVSA